MDIKLVRLVDEYMVSNASIQSLNTGDLELLRKLLYKAISFRPDIPTVKQILSYCTRVFKSKNNFGNKLTKLSNRTFDVLLARQLSRVLLVD